MSPGPVVARAWLVSMLLAGCATSGGPRATDDGEGREDTAKRELADIASFQASGHAEAALAGLDRLLKQLTAWGGAASLSPATRAQLETALEVSRAFVRDLGAKEAAAGRALSAEAELARLAPLIAHAELRDASAAAASRARETGGATCARLEASVAPNTPYWGLGVSRYCAHFGVAFAAPSMTAAVSKLELAGAVTGMTASQTEQLRARIADWFRTSLWFEAGGQATARGSLRGKLETSFEHRAVTRHVPYQDEIETTMSGTVAGARMPAFVTGGGVTKVDRIFEYDAEEHRGHYGMTAKVSVDVGAPSPLTFTLQRVDNLAAYEHDATFPKAGIEPNHDNVPTADAWLAHQLDRMSTRVVLYLNRKFVTLNCRAETVTLDAAARCALAGQRPAPVLASLSAAIGEDAQRLVPILRPPPPETPARAAEKPAPRRPPSRPARPDALEDVEDPVID